MPFDPSLIFLLVLVLLVVNMFRRGARQRRDVAAMQATVVPGNQILTTSGLYATVVAVEEAAVTLETAPGQSSRWDRRAIAKVLHPAATAADPETEFEPDTEFEPGSTVAPEPGAPEHTPDPTDSPDDTKPSGTA